MPDTAGRTPPPRYCAICGEIFSDERATCPVCGRRWMLPSLDSVLDVETVVALLNDFRALRDDEHIDEVSYQQVRAVYEEHLRRIRPHRRAAPPAQDVASADAVPAEVPPSEPLLPIITGWLAKRQADLVLYLGAFLLSVAALIFVNYQGGAVTGVLRSAILLGYTLAFLALGFYLPRWQQVREAGVVFLALGALLVPLNFLALGGPDSGESVPAGQGWLVASSITAAFYLTLGLRGYGRLYLYPGALASLIAWGALGAVFGLPIAWYGAWFAGGAAAFNGVLHLLRSRGAPRLGDATQVLAVMALIVAQATAGFQGRHPFQLPVAYALVGVNTVLELLSRRTTRSLAVLPAVAAVTLLAACWAVFGTGPEWYGLFIAAAGLGYLSDARFDAEQRAHAWQIVGAAFLVSALALTHALQLRASGPSRSALPLTYAEILAGACAAALRWRRREPLAVIPLLVAGLGFTTAWSAGVMGYEWLSCWIAGAGLGYLILAERDPRWRTIWRLAAADTAAAALAVAHASAAVSGAHVAQLPVVWGIVTAGAAWDSRRHRTPGIVAPALLGAVLASILLWAAGAGTVWWGYPFQAAALVLLAGALWQRLRENLLPGAWLCLMGAVAVVPLVFTGPFVHRPVHGFASLGASALILALLALPLRGSLRRQSSDSTSPPAADAAVLAAALLGYAFLLGALAYLNAWLGWQGSDRCWVYAGLGVVTWAMTAVFPRFRPAALVVLASVATGSLALAAGLAASDPGRATLVLLLGTAGPVAAFARTRRWALWVVASVFAAVALGFVWKWQQLNAPLLPLADAGVAALGWAGLARLRRYRDAMDERDLVVLILSWAPWLVALLTALVLVIRRSNATGPQSALVLTREWAVLTIVVAAGATAIVLESARYRRRWAGICGSFGLLVAALLAIAIARPTNVQAFTALVGLYGIALSCTFRTSEKLFGPHLLVHEGVGVSGILFIVLPPAQQSLNSEGIGFGLELIGVALFLLVVGFVVSARWTIAGGVLTLSGVALRWLGTVGANTPQWLILGIVGTALLGMGVLLLFQRERWDRARRRIGRWWLQAPTTGASATPPAAQQPEPRQADNDW